MKLFLATLLAAVSLAANATVMWDWKWCTNILCTEPGAVVSAHGTLTTAGEATSLEPVLAITGEVHGVLIHGLVPIGEDHAFSYDNLFSATEPFVDRGVLFSLVDGRVDRLANIGGFGPARYGEYLSPRGASVYPEVSRHVEIPEPGTLSLVAWFVVLGFLTRKVRGQKN